MVSPQSFPQLWKKLWKFHEIGEPAWVEGQLSRMNLWEQVLARVETKVNRHSFYTWFKPTSFVGEDRFAVTVRPRPRPNLAQLPRADRETLPTLRTTPFQHQTPVFCAHPDQKPMGFPPVTGIWLECPLAFHFRSGNCPAIGRTYVRFFV